MTPETNPQTGRDEQMANDREGEREREKQGYRRERERERERKRAREQARERELLRFCKHEALLVFFLCRLTVRLRLACTGFLRAVCSKQESTRARQRGSDLSGKREGER